MPNKPMKLCNKSMCPNLTRDRYCDDHKHIEEQQKQARKDKAKTKDYDKQRGSAASRGYDHKWREYAKDFLKRNPKCVRCGEPSTCVDHIIPHKGNKGLFWTRFNHQALCTSCHSRKTVLEDGGFGNGQK